MNGLQNRDGKNLGADTRPELRKFIRSKTKPYHWILLTKMTFCKTAQKLSRTRTLAVTMVWLSVTAYANLPDTSVIAWGNGIRPLDYEPPSGLSGVIDIAAGWSHVLALKQDGTVVAWGEQAEWVTPITVPVDLTDVTAIAAGDEFDLALLRGGTVVQWGSEQYGEGSVPDGLSGVTAIAAGSYHSLALKQDGTVVAWGSNGYGQTYVPAGLNGVIAIAAGGFQSMALKQDGTVVNWGVLWNGEQYVPATVPTNLTGVVAIAAGKFPGHSLALKQDGTVVAWGDNEYGQSTVPSGLNGVMAITAGAYQSVALRRDGTVVTWGDSGWPVPSGLRSAIAITAGNLFVTALVYPASSAPGIIVPPQTQTAEEGSTARFQVLSEGAPPLSYQWFFNGTNALAQGTGSVLELTNVHSSQVGAYSVVVTNRFGSSNSPSAILSIIPPVSKSTISVIGLSGETGAELHLVYSDAVGPGASWLPLDTLTLTNNSQIYLDVTQPLPPTRFYQVWQTNRTSIRPNLQPSLSTMIPITGSVGNKVEIDYINQVGPTNAWVRLDTVTLTNKTQVYYDLTMFRQPYRLYRLVVLP